MARPFPENVQTNVASKDNQFAPVPTFGLVPSPADNLLRHDPNGSQESETLRTPSAFRGEKTWRSWWHALLLSLCFLPVVAADSFAEPTSPERTVYPVMTAGWAVPAGADAGDVYGAGPLFGAGVGWRLHAQVSAQLRLDWFRRTGSPSGPPFLGANESSLRWIPIVCRFEYSTLSPVNRWLFLAELGVWRSRERFEFDLIGNAREVSVSATDPAVSLGLGYHAHRGLVAYRLIGRWMGSWNQRQLVQGNAAGPEDSVFLSLWTFGLELSL